MENQITSLKCFYCKNQIWDIPFIDPHDRTFCSKNHGQRFWVNKFGSTKAKAIKLKIPPESRLNNEMNQIEDLYTTLFKFQTNSKNFDQKCTSLSSRKNLLRNGKFHSIRLGLRKPYYFLYNQFSSIMNRKKSNLYSSIDDNNFLEWKTEEKDEFSLFKDFF